MIGDSACESFGIFDNAKHDSELYVLSASFLGRRDHPVEDDKHTVMSAKTAYMM